MQDKNTMSFVAGLSVTLAVVFATEHMALADDVPLPLSRSAVLQADVQDVPRGSANDKAAAPELRATIVPPVRRVFPKRPYTSALFNKKTSDTAKR